MKFLPSSKVSVKLGERVTPWFQRSKVSLAWATSRDSSAASMVSR